MPSLPGRARGPLSGLKRRIRRQNRRRAATMALVGSAMLARTVMKRARA